MKNKLNTYSKSSAFTLIELLIVIGILGVLTALIVANLASGRGRARDSVRKADFSNIKKALRLYYNDFQEYPADTGGVINGCTDGTTACSFAGGEFSANSSIYMKKLPGNPTGIEYTYAVSADGEGFTLSATLENTGDADDGKSQLRCGLIPNIASKTDQIYVDCEK